MLAVLGSQTEAGMWSPAGFFGSRWADPQKGIPIISREKLKKVRISTSRPSMPSDVKVGLTAMV